MAHQPTLTPLEEILRFFALLRGQVINLIAHRGINPAHVLAIVSSEHEGQSSTLFFALHWISALPSRHDVLLVAVPVTCCIVAAFVFAIAAKMLAQQRHRQLNRKIIDVAAPPFDG